MSTLCSSSPDRPKFLSAVTAVPLEAGVLIDGLSKREVLMGPIAQTLLPKLLHLMDGTRTVEELRDAFGDIPQSYLDSTFTQLREWGLIQHADESNQQDDVDGEALDMLRRLLASRGLRDDAFDAYKRLRCSTVVILATRRWSAYLATLQTLISNSGAKKVMLLSDEDALELRFADDAFVITCGDDLAPSILEGLEASAAAGRITWLHTALNRTTMSADIGPIIGSMYENCYVCYRSYHGQPPVRDCGEWEELDQEVLLFCSLIAAETSISIAVPGYRHARRQFQRHQLPSWEATPLRYPRIPGCPGCRPSTLRILEGIGDAKMDLATVYEDYVGLEAQSNSLSSELTDLGPHAFSNAMRSAKWESSRSTKLFSGEVPLSANMIEALRRCPKPNRRSIKERELACLLALSVGIREVEAGRIRRWNASAGNLGSVEVLVLIRHVEGLEPGYYRYDPEEHSLVQLRRRSALDIDSFLGRTSCDIAVEQVDALVILSGAYKRISLKYGAFGYHLVQLDAGSAINQIQLLSCGLGIQVDTLRSFNSSVIEQHFHLEEGNQLITSVLAFTNGSRRFSQFGKLLKRRASATPMSPTANIAGRSLQEVTDLLIEDGRIRYGSAGAGRLHRVRSNCKPTCGIVVQLPKPEEKARSIADVLKQRRSVRSFGDEPVQVGHLGTMLHYGLSKDILEHHSEEGGNPWISLRVIANRMQGLRKGAYFYHFSRHQLSCDHDGISTAQLSDLFVQSEFVDAPVTLLITGSLAAATASYGTDGHRRLLHRAGAVGHRMWMVGLSLGLQGCLIAGLVPDAARRMLSIDGYEEALLFAVATGHQR